MVRCYENTVEIIDKYTIEVYVFGLTIKVYDTIDSEDQLWFRDVHTHLLKCSKHESDLENAIKFAMSNAESPYFPPKSMKRFEENKRRLMIRSLN